MPEMTRIRLREITLGRYRSPSFLHLSVFAVRSDLSAKRDLGRIVVYDCPIARNYARLLINSLRFADARYTIFYWPDRTFGARGCVKVIRLS